MGFMDSDDPNSFLVDFQNAREIWPNMESEEGKRTNWKLSGTMFNNTIKEW